MTETHEDSAEPTMSRSIPDTKTTLTAQDEIRSGSSEPMNSMAEEITDKKTAAERDDAVDGTAEADSTEADQHQPDTASTRGDANEVDGSESSTSKNDD